MSDYIFYRQLSAELNQLFQLPYNEGYAAPITSNFSIAKYFEEIDGISVSTYAIISAEPMSEDALYLLESAIQIHDCDLALNARFVIIHGDKELETEPLVTASLFIDYETQFDDTKLQALYLAQNHDRLAFSNCNAVGLYNENDELEFYFLAELQLELESYVATNES